MLNKIISLTLLLVSSFLFASSPSATPIDRSNDTALNDPIGNSISANWSGYVADTASAYTAVGASWKVPVPEASGAHLATDATWVGIGGVRSRDLIQAGTQATENGRTDYQAWYELLPDYQQIIPLDVNGGDSMNVSLEEISPGVWRIAIADNTTGKSWQKDVAYQSSKSSAEWIEEMPVVDTGRKLTYLPLDNFGTVTFTDGYTVADGAPETIAEAGASSLVMASRNEETLAYPSELTGGSFSVSRANAPAARGGRRANTNAGDDVAIQLFVD